MADSDYESMYEDEAIAAGLVRHAPTTTGATASKAPAAAAASSNDSDWSDSDDAPATAKPAATKAVSAGKAAAAPARSEEPDNGGVGTLLEEEDEGGYKVRMVNGVFVVESTPDGPVADGGDDPAGDRKLARRVRRRKDEDGKGKGKDKGKRKGKAKDKSKAKSKVIEKVTSKVTVKSSAGAAADAGAGVGAAAAAEERTSGSSTPVVNSGELPPIPVRTVAVGRGAAAAAAAADDGGGLPDQLRKAISKTKALHPSGKRRVAPFRYGRGAWNAQTMPDHGSGDAWVKNLTLATFNVTANVYGGQVRTMYVLKVVTDLLDTHQIVGLQEVTQELLRELVKISKVRNDFFVSDTSGATFNSSGSGIVLLSRFPCLDCNLVPLPSYAENSFIFAEFRLNNRSVAVAVVRFDSPPFGDAHVIDAQLHTILKRRTEDFDDVFWIGDFSFGDAEIDGVRCNSHPLPSVVGDLWLALDTDDPGYTLDFDANAMAAALMPERVRDGSGRVDKVLFFTKDAYWAPSTGGLVGNIVVPDFLNLLPSNHFGVVAEFTTRDPEVAQHAKNCAIQ